MTLPERGLKFYPSSHRYRLDGEWVTGVTTLLNVVNKPGLIKWAAKTVAEYVAENRDDIGALYNGDRFAMVDTLKRVPETRRDEAANRGTEVHAFAEQVAQGVEVDVPQILAGHVESCIAFLQDFGIKPVLIEACVGSRQHQYGGKLDLVADHNEGPRAIFDYKTSRRGIYSSAAFQNSAYAFAEFWGQGGDETPMADLGIEASYGVHLRTDGYDVVPLEFGPHIFAEFLSIADVFRINRRAEGDWKTPGTGYVGVPLPERDT